jgi:hypothetical protein
MRKMIINGVPYLWTPLSFTSPDGNTGVSIIVAYPENEPDARPLYLIDNNGTDPFAQMSYAVWLPAFGVKFEDANNRPVTW